MRRLNAEQDKADMGDVVAREGVDGALHEEEEVSDGDREGAEDESALDSTVVDEKVGEDEQDDVGDETEDGGGGNVGSDENGGEEKEVVAAGCDEEWEP